MVYCGMCKDVELEKPDKDHWTYCPKCNRQWQLTDDNTAIKSVTVEIKSAKMKSVTKRIK